uniref:Uncharacterized protein n=1 Tax=Rhizophora mucronata TaxID=61149 RepID=A0A2P2QUD5_RHIMU
MHRSLPTKRQNPQKPIVHRIRRQIKRQDYDGRAKNEIENPIEKQYKSRYSFHELLSDKKYGFGR